MDRIGGEDVLTVQEKKRFFMNFPAEPGEEVPPQYREGRTDFMGMEVLVDPRVLIPRPETELLVNESAALLAEKKVENPFILEIGTGSGAVAMGLLKTLGECRITAADISPGALDVARENLRRSFPSSGVEFLLSDLFEGLGEKYREKFDLVVSNPPYVSEEDYDHLDVWVRAEPREALIGGGRGTECVMRLVEGASRYLKPRGALALEVGYDQADEVKRLMAGAGFTRTVSSMDGNSFERVITGFRHG